MLLFNPPLSTCILITNKRGTKINIGTDYKTKICRINHEIPCPLSAIRLIIANEYKIHPHYVILFNKKKETINRVTNKREGFLATYSLPLSSFRRSPDDMLVIDSPHYKDGSTIIIPSTFSHVAMEDDVMYFLLLTEENIKELDIIGQKSTLSSPMKLENARLLFSEFGFTGFLRDSAKLQFEDNLKLVLKSYDDLFDRSHLYFNTPTIGYSNTIYTRTIDNEFLVQEFEDMYLWLCKLPNEYLIFLRHNIPTQYSEFVIRDSPKYDSMMMRAAIMKKESPTTMSREIGIIDTSMKWQIMILISPGRISYHQLNKVPWNTYSTKEGTRTLTSFFQESLTRLTKKLSNIHHQNYSQYIRRCLDLDLTEGSFSYKVRCVTPLLYKEDKATILLKMLGDYMQDGCYISEYQLYNSKKELEISYPFYTVSQKQIEFFMKSDSEMVKHTSDWKYVMNYFRMRKIFVSMIPNGMSISMRISTAKDNDFLRILGSFCLKVLMNLTDDCYDEYFLQIPSQKSIKLLKYAMGELFPDGIGPSKLYSCQCQRDRQPSGLCEYQMNKISDLKKREGSYIKTINPNNNQPVYIMCIGKHKFPNVMASPNNSWSPTICCVKKKNPKMDIQLLYDKKRKTYEEHKKFMISMRKSAFPKYIPNAKRTPPGGLIFPNKFYKPYDVPFLTYMEAGNFSIYTMERYKNSAPIWSLEALCYYTNKSGSEIISDVKDYQKRNSSSLEACISRFGINMKGRTTEERTSDIMMLLDVMDKDAPPIDWIDDVNSLFCAIAWEIYSALLILATPETIFPWNSLLASFVFGDPDIALLVCFNDKFTSILCHHNYGEPVQYNMKDYIKKTELGISLTRTWKSSKSLSGVRSLLSKGGTIEGEFHSQPGIIAGFIMNIPDLGKGYIPVTSIHSIGLYKEVKEPTKSEFFGYQSMKKILEGISDISSCIHYLNSEDFIIGIKIDDLIYPVKPFACDPNSLGLIMRIEESPSKKNYFQIGKKLFEEQEEEMNMINTWYNNFTILLSSIKNVEFREGLMSCYYNNKDPSGLISKIYLKSERAWIKKKFHEASFPETLEKNVFTFDYQYSCSNLAENDKYEFDRLMKNICFVDGKVPKTKRVAYEMFRDTIARFLGKRIFLGILVRGTVFTDITNSSIPMHRKWVI